MKALWPGQSAWNWKSVDSFYLILPHPIKERALGKMKPSQSKVGALIKFLEKIARQNLLDQDDVLARQLIARRVATSFVAVLGSFSACMRSRFARKIDVVNQSTS